MLPIRVVIESSCTVWDVSCFAFDKNLIFHSSVEATDSVPAEVIWASRDGSTILHRIEDQFADLSYVLCAGASAEALAAAAVKELDGIDARTLMLAMRSRDDAALSDPSIAALGILCPPAFAPDFFEAFQWVLRHPSTGVRRAAIRATTYPAWPELVPELDRLARNDESGDIRTLAGQAAEILRSQNSIPS